MGTLLFWILLLLVPLFVVVVATHPHLLWFAVFGYLPALLWLRPR